MSIEEAALKHECIDSFGKALGNTKQSKQINNRLAFDSIMNTELQKNCVTIEYYSDKKPRIYIQ